MILDLVTLEKTLISKEVKSVIVPGQSGRFEMLNNHAPIVSLLTKGNVKITDINNQEENISISGGSVEISNNKIIILADTD
tara:strand:+ start:516 stop:758 length:243 start_codon:yes stop_codon:yes gene_type:complete